MLRELCRKYTDLTDSDIKILESIEKNLNYFSLMLNTDIFIDCFFKDETKAVVVAHERPETNSQYNAKITGQYVLPHNEPIVFAVKKTGVVIRDEKAFTQEDKFVLQRVVPIKNEEGNIIAVMIQESDITGNVNMERKMETMGKTTEKLTTMFLNHENSGLPDLHNSDANNDVIVWEMHHRIKNNLQMISSILNMQARRSTTEETKRLLKEDISKINSIALIHESVLVGDVGEVKLKELVEKFVNLYRMQIEEDEPGITITVEGDEIPIASTKATPIMLVINELVTNATRHAFVTSGSGTINILLMYGTLYSSVLVSDDGDGMKPVEEKGSIVSEHQKTGLALVKKMVEEKLMGHIRFKSDGNGTSVLFDFRI